jgi:hypothetical protein
MANETDAPAPATTETALVPAGETAIAAPVNAMSQNAALAARLPPRYREQVLFLARPTPEKFADIISKLPDTLQPAMLELIRKTRPKKQGMHTEREGFAPTAVRVNQGTGNDAARPQRHVAGDFYTADSRDLGTELKVAFLGLFEGRTMWPPRDAGGGGEGGGKAPICFSLDRKIGTKYGDCAACPNATRKYNEGGCGREITAWFVDSDLTGIYEIKFTKTSYYSGESLQKILSKCENLWDRWFTMKNEERKEGDRRWFVLKVTPFSDPKVPGAGNTDRQAHPLYEALSQLLDADVYFPNLADTYDRAKSSTDNGGEVAAGVDEGALLSETGSEGAPDYSGGSGGDNADL